MCSDCATNLILTSACARFTLINWRLKVEGWRSRLENSKGNAAICWQNLVQENTNCIDVCKMPFFFSQFFSVSRSVWWLHSSWIVNLPKWILICLFCQNKSAVNLDLEKLAALKINSGDSSHINLAHLKKKAVVWSYRLKSSWEAFKLRLRDVWMYLEDWLILPVSKLHELT